jgi:hypothetical protein
MNSGVCVRGSIYGEHDIDYYGIIEEILELSYLGAQNKVLLLRCHWFDPINGVKIDERYGLVDVKPKSRLNSNEPFVLASQAQQVYYTMYPQSNVRGSSDWWAACKVRRKLFVLSQGCLLLLRSGRIIPLKRRMSYLKISWLVFMCSSLIFIFYM